MTVAGIGAGGMDADLARAFDATWPPAEQADAGGFRVARSPGGGGRLNSARAAGPWTGADIDAAAALQRGRGGAARFLVPDGDTALAEALARRGLVEADRTVVLHAPVAALLEPPVPPVTALAIWPPLAIQLDLWAEAGIGSARLAAMDRAAAPKTALLGRVRDRAAGVGFVAISGPVAMVHALAVAPEFRRMGVAAWMTRRAAHVAAEHGADRLALAVTRANDGALALYARLGFVEAAGYRYFTDAG